MRSSLSSGSLPAITEGAFLAAAAEVFGNEASAVNAIQVRDKPRASGLANCAREQGYYLHGYQPDSAGGNATDAALTQEQGRQWEDTGVAVLAAIGWSVLDRQVALANDYFVSGHPDGRLWRASVPSGLIVGVEFKHLGRWGFEDILKRGFEDSKPDYVLQAALYGHALGWDEVLWLVSSQDASSVRSDMRINQTAKNPAVRWATGQNPKLFIHQMNLHPLYTTLIPIARKRAEWLSANKDALIEREYEPTAGKFPCTYCPYLNRCLADGKGGAVAPKLPFGVAE